MSLTLQMSAGADNLAVWVLRIKSEGTNQVSNGTFDSGSNWTVNADWTITGGEAKYLFVSVGGADLDQTLTNSVDAVPYILEFENTVATGTFTNTLVGTGDSIVAANVTLPVTVGQHRIIIQGVSGKTLLRFNTGGFGEGEELRIDNVKLRKLEVTTYLATEALSLDNTFDGTVLEFNDRLSDINEFMDIQSSGSIGGVSSYNFTVARYNSNATFNGWFEEFFPTYDGATIISRECEVGLVWNTATTDTEITWLMRGRIVDYRFEPRKMIITVLQSTEIGSRLIPFYSVQKDFDNGISFYTLAPDESYGLTLPIIYGDFNIAKDTLMTLPPGNLRQLFFPIVLVDKYKLTYVAGTHKFNVDGLSASGRSLAWRYLPGLKYMMRVGADNGSSTNVDAKLTMNHFDSLDSSGNLITGELLIIPTISGQNNDLSDYDNLVNLVGNDTVTLTSLNEVALAIDGSESGIGQLSRLAGSIQIHVNQTDSVTADSSDDTLVTYFNPEFNSGIGGYGDETSTAQFGWNTGEGTNEQIQDMTNDFVGRDASGVAWTWDELFGLEFIIRSLSGYTNKYGAIWLQVTHIIIADASKLTVAATRPRGRANIVGFSDYTVEGSAAVFDSAKNPDFKPIDNAFARGKGREYGRWIDFATAASGTRDANNGSAADPGFADGALIETPAYIIESIFRDEAFVERDLQIDSSADSTHFVCSDALSREDDYYNNAEIINVTTGTKTYISDYVGSTNTFTIASSDGSMAADDNLFLTNVRGDARIDINSFDIVGNETDGSREAGDGWVFGRAIVEKATVSSMILELCFDSHCMLFETADPDTGDSVIKLAAIDAATSGDTWTKPAFINGVEAVKTSLTPLQNIFTSFTLNYWWNYGSQDYDRVISVDENGFSSPGTNLVIADQLLCKKARETYRVYNSFVYSSNWIYDHDCAELMLQKKIEWFTKQRLIVDWTTGLSDGSIDYIKYERGDQIKLNYSRSIPTGLNNSSFFMITNKRIITVQGAPLIQWRLIEMG